MDALPGLVPRLGPALLHSTSGTLMLRSLLGNIERVISLVLVSVAAGALWPSSSSSDRRGIQLGAAIFRNELKSCLAALDLLDKPSHCL